MLQIFGPIERPDALSNFATIEGGGLGQILNLILKILVIVAGIYSVINLILAGYAFMSAGDDPKKAASAWAKIGQTIIGLVFAAGALVLAAIFGKLIFGSYDFLLKPQIPTL